MPKRGSWKSTGAAGSDEPYPPLFTVTRFSDMAASVKNDSENTGGIPTQRYASRSASNGQLAAEVAISPCPNREFRIILKVTNSSEVATLQPHCTGSRCHFTIGSIRAIQADFAAAMVAISAIA